jgi:hypothetical protein
MHQVDSSFSSRLCQDCAFEHHSTNRILLMQVTCRMRHRTELVRFLALESYFPTVFRTIFRMRSNIYSLRRSCVILPLIDLANVAEFKIHVSSYVESPWRRGQSHSVVMTATRSRECIKCGCRHTSRKLVWRVVCKSD